MKLLRLAAALAAALVLAACSRAPDAAPTAFAPDPALPPDQAALATANAALDAFRAGDAPALYASLPASIRTDISSLLSDAVSAIDPDFWRESSAFLTDLADALDAQSANLASLLGQLPVFLNGDPAPDLDAVPEVAAADVTSVAAFLHSLAASADRDALLRGDFSKILALPALRNVLSQAYAKLDETGTLDGAFSVVRTNPDGSVTLHFGASDEGEDSDWRLVDGAWFPAPVGSDYADMIAEARSAIADFKTSFASEYRSQLLPVLRQLRGVLPSLKAAESPEQLQTAATMAFFALAASFPSN